MMNKFSFLTIIAVQLNIAKKQSSLFICKYYFFIILFLLFIIPFFWFSGGRVDYGGDSSRLYFYDPLSWLKNVSLYSNNSLFAMGMENPSFFMFPFLLLLIGLKYLVHEPFLVNAIFSGVLLSGGFLSVYLIVKELLEDHFAWRLPATISGLFYILSPLLIYDWQKALYSISGILIYPLFFYLFLKFLKRANYHYLLLGILVSFLFSVNFNFTVIPWFAAFFFFAWIFFFFYSKINKKTTFFVKGSLFVLIMFVLIQAFHILPQLRNLTDTSSIIHQTAFSQNVAVDRGLGYFTSIQPYIRLIYNFENLPQYDLATAVNAPIKNLEYDYGVKYQYFYFIFIIMIVWGLILVRNKNEHKLKKLYLLSFVIFIFLLFLMTANINSTSLLLYKSFFLYLPGFAMFRSFINKFALPFIFFYTLLIGFALALIFERLSHIQKMSFLLIFIALIIFSGWPLISGKIVNITLSGSKKIEIPTKFDVKYQSFLDHIKKEKIDNKYLSLPLANEAYQVLAGENGGAYFGPSTLSILDGLKDFCGLSTFFTFKPEILKALQTKDTRLLNRYFSILNIGTIFYNNDDYIYNNFPDYPYSVDLKRIFPNQNKISQFIDSLGYKKKYQEEHFSTYTNEENFLPHLYIPSKIHFANDSPADFTKILKSDDFNIGDAIIYTDTKSKNQTLLDDLSRFKDDNGQVTLEFAKTSPAQYHLRVHEAEGYLPLVFSEAYDAGWKVYGSESVFQNQQDLQKNSLELSQDSNQDFAASREEIKKLTNEKKISYLDSGSSQFVSKEFKKTIQNDNLSLLTVTKGKEVLKDQQFLTNGYANGWLVNTTELCNQINCIHNDDGSYDIDLMIEFYPQKLFYVGSVVSVSTLLGIIIYFIFYWRKSERFKNAK